MLTPRDQNPSSYTAAYTIMGEHWLLFEPPSFRSTCHCKRGQDLSHTFVKKVITSCNVTNSSLRIPRANFVEPKIDTHVLEYIEVQKRIKPSTNASEIQHRLLLDGVMHPNDLSGTSQINRRLREDLMFSKKKLTV